MSGLRAAAAADLVADRPRWDLAAQALVGGACAGCGTTTWPIRAVCFRCGGADVRPRVLAREGVLETWTRVWTPIEGLAVPYAMGMVALDGLRVLGVVTGAQDPRAGAHVRTHVDPGRSPAFWFGIEG